MAALVLLADQTSKALVSRELGDGRVINLIGGFVRLDYTVNSGAAFSIFRAGNLLFIAVAGAASVAILLAFRRIAEARMPVRLALGLVLGGALGNLTDRVRLGHVIDFIDLRWWPVFNLADSAIVVGVVVLALTTIMIRDDSWARK
jgi:signal peptidase II